MQAIVSKAGQLAGLIGMLLMAVGVVGRLAGHYALEGIGTGTIMVAGIGAVCVGCFLLLWRLHAAANDST